MCEPPFCDAGDGGASSTRRSRRESRHLTSCRPSSGRDRSTPSPVAAWPSSRRRRPRAPACWRAHLEEVHGARGDGGLDRPGATGRRWPRPSPRPPQGRRVPHRDQGGGRRRRRRSRRARRARSSSFATTSPWPCAATCAPPIDGLSDTALSAVRGTASYGPRHAGERSVMSDDESRWWSSPATRGCRSQGPHGAGPHGHRPAARARLRDGVRGRRAPARQRAGADHPGRPRRDRRRSLGAGRGRRAPSRAFASGRTCASWHSRSSCSSAARPAWARAPWPRRSRSAWASRRVVSTDTVRQVMRAFFAPDLMPEIQYRRSKPAPACASRCPTESDIDKVGFIEQAKAIAVGINAVVDRGHHRGPAHQSSRACTSCPAFSTAAAGATPWWSRSCSPSATASATAATSTCASGRPTASGRCARYIEHFAKIRQIQEYICRAGREAGRDGPRQHRHGRRAQPGARA